MDNDGIIEVKCSYSVQSVSVADFAKLRTSFVAYVDGEMHLKRNHNYYYHILGAMEISKRCWCDFVVWTPIDCAYERIMFNKRLWKEILLDITAFYFDKMID